MTEFEKIAQAKEWIDKLANGISPLDDTPLPEEALTNNVRLTRCFFYVSAILKKEMERERKKTAPTGRPPRLPFSITQEQLLAFDYSPQPISVTALTKKINWLVREEIAAKRIKKLSHTQINAWLTNIGMLAYREWEDGKPRRFPTVDGESIGLSWQIWENYGIRIPTVYYSEEAQQFIIDNLQAVLATEA